MYYSLSRLGGCFRTHELHAIHVSAKEHGIGATDKRVCSRLECDCKALIVTKGLPQRGAPYTVVYADDLVILVNGKCPKHGHNGNRVLTQSSLH